MLAIEEIREGVVRPVIIELKNSEADIDTLLQVLRYANWALSSTDSIRLHAGQSKTKFKDLDNSNVKLIIVAPLFRMRLERCHKIRAKKEVSWQRAGYLPKRN